MAGADLEEAGQGLRGGIGGGPLGQVLEVATALRVVACRYQRGGQGHDCVPVCPRPAGRLLQRSEHAVAGNWLSHGTAFLETRTSARDLPHGSAAVAPSPTGRESR